MIVFKLLQNLRCSVPVGRVESLSFCDSSSSLTCDILRLARDLQSVKNLTLLDSRLRAPGKTEPTTRPFSQLFFDSANPWVSLERLECYSLCWDTNDSTRPFPVVAAPLLTHFKVDRLPVPVLMQLPELQSLSVNSFTAVASRDFGALAAHSLSSLAVRGTLIEPGLLRHFSNLRRLDVLPWMQTTDGALASLTKLVTLNVNLTNTAELWGLYAKNLKFERLHTASVTADFACYENLKELDLSRLIHVRSWFELVELLRSGGSHRYLPRLEIFHFDGHGYSPSLRVARELLRTLYAPTVLFPTLKRLFIYGGWRLSELQPAFAELLSAHAAAGVRLESLGIAAVYLSAPSLEVLARCFAQSLTSITLWLQSTNPLVSQILDELASLGNLTSLALVSDKTLAADTVTALLRRLPLLENFQCPLGLCIPYSVSRASDCNFMNFS